MEVKNDDKKALTEEEIFSIIKGELVKEKTITYLEKLLEISRYEIMGYVKKLKDKGINIDYYEKDGEISLLINNHPDLSKENSYRIDEDINTNTKIGVISDLRFGSKNEQIAILNDIYKNFLNEGVKYVIITGNLVEGPYTSSNLQKFGKSLITNDPISQVNHLIEYFPKIEGIKTLFITGDLDHRCSKKINIGEYIEASRSDMFYLGPISCTINLNNVKIRVEQLGSGEPYTIAYPPQKYSRSMSSYENYDAVFLGGGLSMQYFPQIRDTQIFSIPSVVDRTPSMRKRSQSNTIGAMVFDISYTKTGKLKRLVPTMIPYYEPSKETYLTVKKVDIKKNETGSFVNISNSITDENKHFDKLNQMYNMMKKEESFDSLRKRFDLSENELYGVITILQQYGREIELIDINDELIVRKSFQKRRSYTIKPPKEELHKKEILVVSDTHYGSIWCQPSMVNTAVYEAYNRGITDIIHAGDITDGDYSRIRPNHVHEVFLYGATGQYDYVLKHLPKYSGMKWHVICGSHDQTHLFNYGFDMGKELSKRNDIEYLGQDRGMLHLDKCVIEVFHPGGGSSRILSTKPQNGIDQLPSHTKPNLSIRGHYHKSYYMLYRNIHTILAPCNVDQSSFMMKQELPNLMGDYFLTIYYDDNGFIHYLIPEAMVFDQSSVRKNDWESPKKYIKNKIITTK